VFSVVSLGNCVYARLYFHAPLQAQRRPCISAIKGATKGAIRGATKGAKIAQAQNRLKAQNPQLLRVLWEFFLVKKRVMRIERSNNFNLSRVK
jgi:hypothetical protein